MNIHSHFGVLDFWTFGAVSISQVLYNLDTWNFVCAFFVLNTTIKTGSESWQCYWLAKKWPKWPNIQKLIRPLVFIVRARNFIFKCFVGSPTGISDFRSDIPHRKSTLQRSQNLKSVPAGMGNRNDLLICFFSATIQHFWMKFWK